MLAVVEAKDGRAMTLCFDNLYPRTRQLTGQFRTPPYMPHLQMAGVGHVSIVVRPTMVHLPVHLLLLLPCQSERNSRSGGPVPGLLQSQGLVGHGMRAIVCILTAVIGMSGRSVGVETIENLLVQLAKGGAAVARTMVGISRTSK